MSKGLWNTWLDLIFPHQCVGCRMEGALICDFCFERFEYLEEQKCPLCFRVSANGSQCSRCFQREPDFPLKEVISWCEYKDRMVMAKLIHALKYEGIVDAREVFRRYFQQRKDFVPADGWLCPVPLEAKRQRWRGFNQAEILAEELSFLTGMPVVSLLMRVHFSKPQMELTSEERAKNVVGAFQLNKKFTQELQLKIQEGALPKIWLVDDVATTLSTLREAASVLSNTGVPIVSAIVVARKS